MSRSRLSSCWVGPRTWPAAWWPGDWWVWLQVLQRAGLLTTDCLDSPPPHRRLQPAPSTQPRHADTYTYNASLCIFMLEVAYKWPLQPVFCLFSPFMQSSPLLCRFLFLPLFCPRIFPIFNFYMNFATCQMADTDIFLHASCIIEHKNILWMRSRMKMKHT